MKKTQASRPTNLKAIGAAPTTEPPLMDHEETVRLWPVLNMPPPVKVSNKFSPLTDSAPDTGDEADMVRALSALTSNIHKASDKSKSQKSKRNRGTQPMNLSHLNAVARRVKSGEISMPEVDLEHNDQFDYVWAMVDSGAGANVARKEHVPSSKRVSAPEISLTVANGEVLPNQGARSVECHDTYGSHRSTIFDEAPVEMPILAATELAQEGVLGSEVRLRSDDGEITDVFTGKQTPFIKRVGVHFTRIYLPKSSNGNPVNEPLFVRPDMWSLCRL